MRFLFLLLLAVTLSSTAQVRVVQLDAFPGKPGNSIGIVFDDKKVGELAAYVQGTVYISVDTGKTWSPARMPALPGDDRHEVTVTADAQDNLYYYHTTERNGTGIVFRKSVDMGRKWTELAPGPETEGKNSYITFGSHPRKDGIGFLWTRSTETEREGCTSYIYIAVSNSGGKKWAEPVRINNEPGDCSGKGTMVQGAPPMVTRDGKVFVVWAVNDRIFIDRSYDGGDIWLRTDIPVGEQPGGWKLVVPGVPSLNSMPSFAVDNTEFRTTGTLYIAYADQKSGAIDTDIWVIRSPNFGDNWTYPLRVNLDEPGKYQYSPRVAVDQQTGYMYVTYLDRRNYDDDRSDIYLAWSGDAGGTFSEIKINETPIAAGTLPLLSVGARKGVISVVWAEEESDKTVVRAGVLFQALLK
jgi:hypothetical protein